MKNRIASFAQLLLICALSLTVTEIFGQAARKPSIAVITFSHSGKAAYNSGQEITEQLIDGLVNSGKFTVVDRSKTTAITAEQLEGLGGSIDPASAASVGKKIGAQFMVLGNVSEMSQRTKPLAFGLSTTEGHVKFNLRAVNSTTGEILVSQTFEKKSSSMGINPLQDSVSKAVKDALTMLITRLGSMPGVEMETVGGAVIISPAALDCSRVTGARAPKIMVVIPEIHITQKIPDPAGETEIIKRLVNRGFNLVDQGQIAVIRDRERTLMATKNPAAAAALGAEFGANIIIIGEAFSELASRNNNMISTRARVEAKAVQTDTARILAAEGTFASGLDIAEFVSAKTALRNAGGLWADYFVGQICKEPGFESMAVATPVANSGGIQGPPSAFTASVEIAISNITFTQLKQFADRLEQIPGVKSVEKKLTANVARVDVQFDGNAEKLADRISETKFGLLKVKIIGLTGSKIEISVGK